MPNWKNPYQSPLAEFGIVAGKSKSWIYKNKDRVLEVENADLVEKFIEYIVQQKAN